MGKQGEDLFKELTGAVKSALEDDKKHIDFYWGDKLVDVIVKLSTLLFSFLIDSMSC